MLAAISIAHATIQQSQSAFDAARLFAGWQVRLPLVAPSEREAVLRGWAPFCGGTTPRLRCVPFSAVRQLSPDDFVAALAHDLRAAGVVVGNNYRFGFKVGLAVSCGLWRCSNTVHQSICKLWPSDHCDPPQSLAHRGVCRQPAQPTRSGSWARSTACASR